MAEHLETVTPARDAAVLAASVYGLRFLTIAEEQEAAVAEARRAEMADAAKRALILAAEELEGGENAVRTEVVAAEARARASLAGVARAMVAVRMGATLVKTTS